MASLMAAAATAPGKVQFARCEVNFASPGRRATHVLPSRTALRRKVEDGRRSGVAIRASSSGTADENMIPESGPTGAGIEEKIPFIVGFTMSLVK